MTEAKQHPEAKIDPKALAEVSNKVDLTSIRLESISSKVEQSQFVSASAIFLEFEYNCLWRRRDERPGFDVRFEFRSSLSQSAVTDQPSSSFFKFELVYILEYALKEIAPSDWEHRLDLFANINGVVNIWPYVRAELASTLSKTGLPQLMLPVYRPGRPSKGRVEFRASSSDHGQEAEAMTSRHAKA
ncbi:hypothetical protein [Myxococcus faecalis]|uniref:hypothetical protein n=1 Tax=Myxococcus faecalis TaxID=3115646 RepID=UPI003CF53A3F